MHVNAQAGQRPGNRMLYIGDIAFTPSPQRLVGIRRGVVAVENGIVSGCYESMDDVPADWLDAPKTDFGDALVIPGFNDLHIHAPQYPTAGLGLDKELLPWLETYTFPAEARFASPDYARIWYQRFIQRMWEGGTLRFSAFATLHREATLTLARLAQESGLRPVIGKVNMDRNGSEELSESTEESLDNTVAVIETMRSETPDIGYIVTPRFVPPPRPSSCAGSPPSRNATICRCNRICRKTAARSHGCANCIPNARRTRTCMNITGCCGTAKRSWRIASTWTTRKSTRCAAMA